MPKIERRNNMDTLVVYKSKTGFAKRYAEIIATALDAQLMPLKDVKPIIMSRYKTVVFGGGLYAASINGLKKAKKMYSESNATRFAVFACGATPNVAASTIESMWKKNFTPTELAAVPHFYMQAGLAYEDMSPVDRAVMKMVAKLKGKPGVENPLLSSHDISSEEYIKPLVDALK